MTSPFELFEERWHALQQHLVARVAALYVGVSWVLLQGVSIFGVSVYTLRTLTYVLLTGLVAVCALAWVAELRSALAHETTTGLRPARRSRVWFGWAAGLIALGTLGWWARGRFTGLTVVRGADVIAVFPFTVNRGAADLGSGIADLLSTSLDQVGAIRVVDPRAVQHGLHAHGFEEPIQREQTYRIAHDLQAGAVLTGNVLAAGRAVQINAVLRATDGTLLAQAETAGSADSVFALADDIALKLLREIWRSRQPLPSIHISAITTRSVPAIRAYLKGAQFFRSSRWDSAEVYMRRAVAEDSTFALALFDLAHTIGWTRTHGDPESIRYSEAAARFASRLPERERRLLNADMLLERGEAPALDSLRLYTVHYPDDVIGWLTLADAELHSQHLFGTSNDVILADFRRVQYLDSTLMSAFPHPLEIALFERSRPLFDSLFTRFTQASARDLRKYQRYRTAVFGPADSIPQMFARTMREPGVHPSEIGYPASMLLLRILLTEEPLTAIVLQVADSLKATVPPHMPQLGFPVAATLLLGTGATEQGLRTLEAMHAGTPEYAGTLVRAAGAGVLPRAALVHALQRIKAAPGGAVSQYAAAVIALTLGDVESARRIASTPLPADSVALYPHLNGLMHGVLAWIDIQRGDTVGGVQRLRSSLADAGYTPFVEVLLGPPLYFALATSLCDRPATRPECIQRLILLRQRLPFAVPAEFKLAEVYEAAGRRAEAARAYQHVIHAWAGGDSVVQPRVKAARRALERMSGSDRKR